MVLLWAFFQAEAENQLLVKAFSMSLSAFFADNVT